MIVFHRHLLALVRTQCKEHNIICLEIVIIHHLIRFTHFLFRHDVPDENIGLSSRGRLTPRAGGLGGRPSSLFKLDVGGLGTFADVECFLLAPSGLLIRFDEYRLGLDWVRFMGGWGRSWEGVMLISTVWTGWLGKWYSCKRNENLKSIKEEKSWKSLIGGWEQFPTLSNSYTLTDQNWYQTNT